MSINIITSFYISKNSKRTDELCKSLTNNLNNNNIKKIHLFVDDNKCIEYLKNKHKELYENKIKICGIGNQPLYSDLFKYANSLNNEICMIINSDIWLHSIENINILKLLDNNNIFSLTRYEHDFTCPLIDKYNGSHDAFLFKSPINVDLLKYIQHKQNVLGSENVVLYELERLKYKIYNPCIQIKIIHEHLSEVRDDNRIRINWGDINVDGVYSIRSQICKPCIFKY